MAVPETAPFASVEPEEAPVRWGMGDAVAGSVLAVVFSTLVGGVVLAASGREDFGDLSLEATALLTLPLWAALLGAPVWATYLKGRRSLAADFGLHMRWTDVPLGLAAGLVGQFGLLVLLGLLYRLLGIDLDQVGETAEELTGEAGGALGVVLLVVMVAIVAPLLEELFYRGLWLRAIERRFGRVVAVVGSSLLFGAAHLQPYDFPALAGFGVIAAVLTVRSGRLGLALWAHVAFNLTAVVSLLAT